MICDQKVPTLPLVELNIANAYVILEEIDNWQWNVVKNFTNALLNHSDEDG